MCLSDRRGDKHPDFQADSPSATDLARRFRAAYLETGQHNRAVDLQTEHGRPIAPERLTLGTYLQQWLQESVRLRVRPSTFVSYSGIVRLHLIPILGRVPLQHLAPREIQLMLNSGLEGGMSPRRVQYIHAVLHRALNQAVKWQLLSRNVASLVDAPHPTPKEPTFLNPEQSRQFLRAASGERLEALYTVALAMGLRSGEALGLRWQDVDFEQSALRIRHQLQRIDGKPQLVGLKTARSRRTLYMPTIVVEGLRQHRVKQLEERLVAGLFWRGSEPRDPSSLVFTTPIGTPLDPSNLRSSYHALWERAGLPKMRFHDLRHSCATLLLAQGVAPRVVPPA